MQIQKIYIGGWFQRTTLHLTEVWDFLKYGKSHLGFPQNDLDSARVVLAIADTTRENGPLEYIAVKTSIGINYRIYEDGLIVLEKEPSRLVVFKKLSHAETASNLKCNERFNWCL